MLYSFFCDLYNTVFNCFIIVKLHPWSHIIFNIHWFYSPHKSSWLSPHTLTCNDTSVEDTNKTHISISNHSPSSLSRGKAGNGWKQANNVLDCVPPFRTRNDSPLASIIFIFLYNHLSLLLKHPTLFPLGRELINRGKSLV